MKKKLPTLPTRQIGKLGELLVQYKLLQFEVESAHLTTDAGIDLVAYAPGNKRAFTIQVKTNLRPKPAGGKGKPSLDWWIPDDSPAQLFAFVDVSESRAWLFAARQLARMAQQHPNGRYHFYMYVDPERAAMSQTKRYRVFEFESFRLENRVKKLF